MDLQLKLLSLDLAIAKIDDPQAVTDQILKADFYSLTKTEDECSLVIDSEHIPDHLYASVGWRAFMLVGPLDFSLVGVLKKVIEPLSEQGISIFTISTFDTDYILVKKEQVNRSIEVLKEIFNVIT